MEILQQFLINTPIWVWAIFAWLLFRGIKARRPGDTTLAKMAMIPVIFTAWGLYDLVTLYGVTAESAGLWLTGIVLGAVIGWFILAHANIVADRAAGVLHRPADLTLLPLLMVTFAIKYGFGVIAAVAPHLLAETCFRIADLMLSGLFTGIFIGKFIRYAWIWRSAPASAAATTQG